MLNQELENSVKNVELESAVNIPYYRHSKFWWLSPECVCACSKSTLTNVFMFYRCKKSWIHTVQKLFNYYFSPNHKQEENCGKILAKGTECEILFFSGLKLKLCFRDWLLSKVLQKHCIFACLKQDYCPCSLSSYYTSVKTCMIFPISDQPRWFCT